MWIADYTTSWLTIQGSPIGCVCVCVCLSNCVWYESLNTRSLHPSWAVGPNKTKCYLKYIQLCGIWPGWHISVNRPTTLDTCWANSKTELDFRLEKVRQDVWPSDPSTLNAPRSIPQRLKRSIKMTQSTQCSVEVKPSFMAKYSIYAQGEVPLCLQRELQIRFGALQTFILTIWSLTTHMWVVPHR